MMPDIARAHGQLAECSGLQQELGFLFRDDATVTGRASATISFASCLDVGELRRLDGLGVEVDGGDGVAEMEGDGEGAQLLVKEG